jgi:sterol desaturase/sphingolipid hydroxylase (fatty acid hydroxylase superfamily)
VLRRLCHPYAVMAIAIHLSLLGLGVWIVANLAPDSVTLSVFGHEKTLSDLHRRLFDRAAIGAGLLPSVFLIEYCLIGWRACSLRHLLMERSPSSGADVGCFLFQLTPGATLVCGLMSFGAVYLSGGGIRYQIMAAGGWLPTLAGAPLLIQSAILLLLYTLCDYASHRLDHTRLFWPLHRFHHSAETFTVLTAGRVHPAAFTALVSVTLPAALLDADAFALADVGFAIVVLRLLIHSRIDSDFGWIGRWIAQSPRHHALHHSLNRMPVNLALLPVWDRLFGTWHDVTAAPARIGAVTPYRHGVWIGGDVWRDYVDFWKGTPSIVARLAEAVRAPRRHWHRVKREAAKASLVAERQTVVAPATAPELT